MVAGATVTVARVAAARVLEEWEVEETAEVVSWVEARMELETVAAVKEEVVMVMVMVVEATAAAAAVVTLTQVADLRFSTRSRCSRC
jgi:hypothetical protein